MQRHAHILNMYQNSNRHLTNHHRMTQNGPNWLDVDTGFTRWI